jgi:hypothetical protein
MSQLLAATNNRGTWQELVSLRGDVPLQVVTLHDLGLHFTVEATGTS